MNTDLAFMLCLFYAEPRIYRVGISSDHARAISRNLVHSLKAKSVHIQIILCIRTQKGTRLWDRKITEIRGGPKRGGNLARNSSGRRAGDRAREQAVVKLSFPLARL